MAVVIGTGCGGAGGSWLWRTGGEAGQCGAPPPAGLRREPGGGAAGVAGLAGVPGGEDALVADGEQAGKPERERVRPVSRHQPRAMLVVAGSLMVAKARSALVRRA